MENGVEKKIVFWGVGKIGKNSLKCYPKEKPLFFIDSFSEQDEFCGIKVKKPEEIEDWSEFFVVITIKNSDHVKKILEEKGLIYQKDFQTYVDFFSEKPSDIERSLTEIKEYLDCSPEYLNATLLVTPFVFMREPGKIINFFKAYGEKRKPQKCVALSMYDNISFEKMEEMLGFPVFNEPRLYLGIKYKEAESGNYLLNKGLSVGEKEWIRKLEAYKCVEENEHSFNVSCEIYLYYRQVIELLKPLKIVIWGGWMRGAHILAHLAEIKGIPYRFMEYGWLPGTFQFDPVGIAGQSEYARKPEKLLDVKEKMSDEDVKNVFNFIKNTHLDTMKFSQTESDKQGMAKLDVSKKTVFFVGMSDGIDINPESVYWTNYVSEFFSSTAEAVDFVYEVCQRHQWNLLFKPHPDMKNETYLEELKKKSGIVLVKDTEIDALIKMSDVVVSIASAVDYKVLIYEKPLVQLGKTGLYRKGCTYEVEAMENVEEQLCLAMKQGMTEEQKENYIKCVAKLLERYLWDDLTEKEVHYGLSVERDFFE